MSSLGHRTAHTYLTPRSLLYSSCASCSLLNSSQIAETKEANPASLKSGIDANLSGATVFFRSHAATISAACVWSKISRMVPQISRILNPFRRKCSISETALAMRWSASKKFLCFSSSVNTLPCSTLNLQNEPWMRSSYDLFLGHVKFKQDVETIRFFIQKGAHGRNGLDKRYHCRSVRPRTASCLWGSPRTSAMFTVERNFDFHVSIKSCLCVALNALNRNGFYVIKTNNYPALNRHGSPRRAHPKRLNRRFQ